MQYDDIVICFENNYKLPQLKKCTNCAPELPLLFSGITSEKRGVKSVVLWCLWAECLCFYWSNPRQAETVKAVWQLWGIMMNSWRKKNCFGFHCVFLDICSKVQLQDACGGFLYFFPSFFVSFSVLKQSCLATELNRVESNSKGWAERGEHELVSAVFDSSSGGNNE